MKAVKNLLGYIGCICITVMVAYFIDGTAGIILTAALTCAFVISLAVTLVVRRFLKVEISLSRDLLGKGDSFMLNVNISKSIIIPAPVVKIKADSTPHLKFEGESVYSGSVAGKEVTTIPISMKAVHSGAAEVSLTNVRLSDFLGILSFSLPFATANADLLNAKVSVYPNIPDTGMQPELLKTVSQFAADDDDEEEESDEIAVGATGVPGYEHRQYYPGDPIKKINWKLSSKRDIYMVRLDEKVSAAGQLFFLDCPQIEESEYVLTVRDNVIEGALAMMSMLVRDGREASFFRYGGGMWLRTDIHTMADVYTLQESFSDYTPHTPPQTVPPEIASSGKTPICFTAACADNYASASDIAAHFPNAMLISAECAELIDISSNMWIINSEFELKQKKH